MAKKMIKIFIFLIPLVLIFKNWFIFPFLSAHDFPFFFKETLSDFSMFPPAWSPGLGIGLGGEIMNFSLNSFVYFIVALFVNALGFSWELVYRIFIFGLFLVISIFSIVYLLKKTLQTPTFLQLLLSVLIFTANTYILMILDGGQMGVALAYSIAPLVLGAFIKLTNDIYLKREFFGSSSIAALTLVVQIMFDVRIVLLTMLIVATYMAYSYFIVQSFSLKSFLRSLVLIGIVIFGFNAYWTLPIFFSKSDPSLDLLSSFNSIENFRFFSFAVFSQSLSLLHPNWPENIFGKSYFMRPEFLLLPLFAYVSLLFPKKNKKILFFATLGILGAFLAKGANQPFPQINVWLFTNIPFFAFFRDPTKFYLLTILSYGILIPFATGIIQKWLNEKLKINLIDNKIVAALLKRSILLISILYLLFLIRPVFFGQLNGTFARYEVPKEYIKLKNFLHSQKDFSRTLWIPTQHRFNYFSYSHPAVSGSDLFSATSSGEIIRKLHSKNSAKLLSDLSIQYIIVPYDSFGEIFVKDRRYDVKQHDNAIKELDSIKWINKLDGFGRIAVYKAPSVKDHFWLNGKGDISYTQIAPYKYQLNVVADGPSRVIFTDAYNKYWIADNGNKILTSVKTDEGINSFLLDNKGEYKLIVYFSKQRYYVIGGIVTGISIFLFLIMILYRNRK